MLTVEPEYLYLLQKDFENFVSMNHASRVAQKRGVPVQHLTRTVRPEETSHQAVNELQDKNKERYAVERIIHHVTTKTRPYYVVRWSGYSTTEDTDERRDHVPAIFVNTDRHRMKR